MNEFFDKEEWASRKQQDRESAYAMVDDALKKVGTDGKAFQTYLDVQSKFERYTDGNNTVAGKPSRRKGEHL